MNKRNGLLAAGIAAGLVLVGGGAFAAGQATRASDQEVTRRVATAVQKQVERDEIAKEKAVELAKAEQKKRTARIWKDKLHAAVRKARRAAYDKGYASGQSDGYVSGQSDGYEAGQSAGYESGHDAGHRDGLIEGSDELTCSDDPDVTWLPPCTLW